MRFALVRLRLVSQTFKILFSGNFVYEHSFDYRLFADYAQMQFHRDLFIYRWIVRRIKINKIYKGEKLDN